MCSIFKYVNGYGMLNQKNILITLVAVCTTNKILKECTIQMLYHRCVLASFLTAIKCQFGVILMFIQLFQRMVLGNNLIVTESYEFRLVGGNLAANTYRQPI